MSYMAHAQQCLVTDVKIDLKESGYERKVRTNWGRRRLHRVDLRLSRARRGALPGHLRLPGARNRRWRWVPPRRRCETVRTQFRLRKLKIPRIKYSWLELRLQHTGSGYEQGILPIL